MTMSSDICKHKRAILFTIFFVSFILRLLFSITNYTYENISNWKDAALYLEIGESFADGDLYPQIGSHGYLSVAPGLPFIIAICIWLFGTGVFPMLVLNSLAGGTLVVLLYLIGEQLVGSKSALFMALWGTLNYNMMKYGFQLLKEPYIFLLMALLILCSLRFFMKSNMSMNLLWVSAIMVALIHIDERYFYLLPLMLCPMFIVAAKQKMLRQIAFSLIVIAALMIPWTVRNYRQFGQVVIVTTNLNSSLQKVFGDAILPTPEIVRNVPLKREFHLRDVKTTLSREDGSRLQWKGTVGNRFRSFMEHMRPSYLISSWVYTLDGWKQRRWSLGHNILGITFYGIYIPFYLMGLLGALYKRRLYVVFLLSIPIIHGLVHAVLPFPLERYRMTTDFIVVLGALWGISESATYLKIRNKLPKFFFR